MSLPDASSPTPAAPLVLSEVSGWQTLRLLNRYHWFVFTVAALGWLADCMDQQLFNLARVSAVTELITRQMPGDDPATVQERNKQVKFVGELLDVDLPDGLGQRRHLLRHPRRPLGA